MLFKSRLCSLSQLFSHRTVLEGRNDVFFPGPVPRLVVPGWSTCSVRLVGGEGLGRLSDSPWSDGCSVRDLCLLAQDCGPWKWLEKCSMEGVSQP